MVVNSVGSMVVMVVFMFCVMVMVEMCEWVGNSFGQKLGKIVLYFWQIMFYIRIDIMKVSLMLWMLIVYR